MCGFIFAVSCGAPIDPERFNQARDSMRHRGPDASRSEFFNGGSVALGHRRLSIQDLSSAGNQPMQLGNLWVVFNGEIYNFPELRRDLTTQGCRFRSRSDTEVLLHGYRQWGRSLCDRLEGMFAFAIFDEETGESFLARDHVGQKPLYYAVDDGHFVAASEIKAIRALLGDISQTRKESILDYLIYDFVPDPYTWYDKVMSVMPGSHMTVRRQRSSFKIDETPYWTYAPSTRPPAISADDAIDRLDAEIRGSVQRHMVADVEVGALLSGGVDSGSIVALASSMTDSPIRTFSIGFGAQDGDELPRAKEVARRYGTIHTERIVRESDFQSSIDHILDIFDQPFADTSLVPTEAVSSVAANHVKVVLTGDGGDETFGGYNLGSFISPFLNRTIWSRARLDRQTANEFLRYLWDAIYYLGSTRKQWNARSHYPRYRSSASREMRVLPTELRRILGSYDYAWMYERNTIPGLDAFRQAQWHHIKHILPGKMLVKIDRCSMQHSIEARAPFLSHRLIEAMLDLPTEAKNPRSDWYKGLLRRWATDKLPDSVLHAPKRGFAVPGHWKSVSEETADKTMLAQAARAGLFSQSAWGELMRKRTVMWKMLQVEQALACGLLS